MSTPQQVLAPGTREQTQNQRREVDPASFRTAKVPAKIRTRQACDRCRELRTKCGGGPRCSKCARDNARCIYSDGKRERNKKQLAEASQSLKTQEQRTSALLTALNTLISQPDFDRERYPDIIRLVEDASQLDDAATSVLGFPQSSQGQQSRSDSRSNTPGVDADEEMMSHAGESLAQASVGSPGHQDKLPQVVDLSHGGGLTGYVGKLAASYWIVRSRDYLQSTLPEEFPHTNTRPQDQNSLKSARINYFMEEQDLLGIDEDFVDCNVLPPWPSALIMMEAHFHSMQVAFCFVQRDRFLSELNQLYRAVMSSAMLSTRQRHVLALANMVWALGSRWLEMTELDHRVASTTAGNLVSEGHQTYYARARVLGLDHRILVEHPDIITVQSLALLTMYLIINGSIQRACSILAQATLHATSLGLHLDVMADLLDDDRRLRSMLWYTLFRLDILLSELTGRPKCMSVANTTIARPFVLSKASCRHIEVARDIYHEADDLESRELWSSFLGPNRSIANSFSGGTTNWTTFGGVGVSMLGMHFAVLLELSALSDKISDRIYLQSWNLTWFDVQQTVRALEKEVQLWHSHLPFQHKFESIGEYDIDPRQVLEVEIYFCSINMMLYRPFLCSIHIKDESEASADFNKSCARRGVEAALHLLEILPDHLPIAHAAQVMPWWSLLHFLNQAAAVLLLELCLKVEHLEQDSERTIIAALRKALSWLWALAANSKGAVKAYTIFRALFEQSPHQRTSSIELNIPAEAPRPPNWDLADAKLLEEALSDLWN